MDIADLGRMGFLPLRDHDVNRRHNAANTLYGVQMEAPDDENKARPERGTAGDVVGAVLVKAKDGEREGLGSWAFAMPAMAETPPRSTREGTSQVADVPVQSFTPIQDRADTSPLKRYETFQPLPATVAGSPNRGLPRDYPVLLVNALREDKAAPLAFPSGPLVAVNKAGEPGTGSLVSDCQNDESMDPERQARLQSLVRVARVQDPVLPGGPNGGVLALQYGVSGKDQIAGYGLISMPADSGNRNSSSAAGFTTENNQTQVRGVVGDLAVLFGPMSAARGGPITLGDQSCQHLIGQTRDGERVQTAHLSTDAVFWQGSNREGPIAFDTAPYTNPAPGPRRIPGYLTLDPNATYNLPTGPSGSNRQHFGKWRIEADSWVEEQKDGPPPTGDAFPPPPGSTVVRTPGGAGGPPRKPGENNDNSVRDGRGPGPFDPGYDGYNPKRPPGGRPPPVAGGGVRGPGGGNPEPDSPWTVGPWGYTNPAWPLGIDTSLYRPFPDPYAPIGPYDFGFGYGDGFIATAGTAGRYLNVQNNAFRPYDYAAIPPVLANPYPGTSKASFPNPISTTAIAVKAFPTDPLAQDTRRTPTNDPFLEARRPQTMNLEGYAYGNGFDGGWTYTNPPGTRTPTGKGGLVILPGDLTLQQYRTGVYPTQPDTTLVALKDDVGIGWGVPLENGGVQGVRAVADSAGLSFRPTDSSGVEIAGVGLRIGEGGVIVTGKLTVTGRLDPTTLEITDTAGAQVPNGKWGFGFDSTFHASRPYWFRGDTNVRTAIALDGGLSTRHVSGLVVRYASATTITVSAGKARDKADGADMTLSSEVTVNRSTANAALGYERKSLTGTHTLNFGTGAVTGTGSAYLSEFGTRALTGTFTNSGSATVTGTGTKFLSEVAVNDLIGVANTTNCLFHVLSIESDTSLTLSVYPSSVGKTDFSGSTGVVVEQPIIESAAGVAHGLWYITSNTAAVMRYTTGSATETGVAAYASSKSGMDSASDLVLWRAVWLLSGGSGTTVVFSTQRTTPYLSTTGYTTSYRRIGWVRLATTTNDIIPDYGSDGGATRWVRRERATAAALANAGTTSSWQSVDLSSYAPPTARALELNVAQYEPVLNHIVYFRGRGLGDAAVQRGRVVVASPVTTGINHTSFTIACDGAQYVDHGGTGSTTDGTDIHFLGYEDTLE